jgi:hypothetical protein
MTKYSIQFLKNKITDRIHVNHERSLTGADLQEMLLDIVDSLVGELIGGGPGSEALATSIPRDTFPEFYGLEFQDSSLYFAYLNEYYLPELSTVTGFLLRVVAPTVSGAGVPFQIRVVSDTNESLGLYNSNLSNDLQLIEFTLSTPATFELVMIQYKSTVPFFVKEVLLLNNTPPLP